MKPDEMITQRKADWQQLTLLLDRSERDLSGLSSTELEQLSRLYRAASADLALVQRDFPRHDVARYLNQLVARGHALIYRSEPLTGQEFWRFITEGYPRLWRECAPFILGAFLLFVLPALLAGGLGLYDPQSAAWLMPEGMQSALEDLEQRQLWTDIQVNERPAASSFIMRNNIQVSFLAFSGGMTAGLLTGYVMLTNGLMLGGLLGVAYHYGVGNGLANFVIGHGVIELSVIFFSGGAGLMMGWAVLRPGLRRRGEALAEAARKAVRLLSLCVPLLVIAGLIEGFLSPSSLPWTVKWGAGLISGVLLYGYLIFAGRETQKRSL